MNGKEFCTTENRATLEAPWDHFTVEAVLVRQLDPGSTEVRDNLMHVRRAKALYQVKWTFSRDGSTVYHHEVVDMNVVLSTETMTGSMWGTFEYQDERENVIWKGCWHGERCLVNGEMISTIYDIGSGLGPNEGLLFHYEISAANVFDPAAAIPFTGKGYVQKAGQHTT